MSSSAATPSETANFDAIKASATFVPPAPKAAVAAATAPSSGGGGGGGGGGEKPEAKKGNKKEKEPAAPSDAADTRVADAGMELADEERIEPMNPKDIKLDNFCADFEFA